MESLNNTSSKIYMIYLTRTENNTKYEMLHK